jgi:hypothetical protein
MATGVTADRGGREPRHPRLPHGVAVERPRLGGDERRLADAGKAGHDDGGGATVREEHADEGRRAV